MVKFFCRVAFVVLCMVATNDARARGWQCGLGECDYPRAAEPGAVIRGCEQLTPPQCVHFYDDRWEQELEQELQMYSCWRCDDNHVRYAVRYEFDEEKCEGNYAVSYYTCVAAWEDCTPGSEPIKLDEYGLPRGCRKCSDWTYTDGTNQACKKLENGLYATNCDDALGNGCKGWNYCSPGYECENGRQTPCPLGTYNSYEYINSGHKCKGCPSGPNGEEATTKNNASTSIQDCILTESGGSDERGDFKYAAGCIYKQ